MTQEEIHKKAQSLVAGSRSVKIGAIWDFKKNGYLGRGCLERRGGGVGLAMPHIPIKEGQIEEYQTALKIIKETERLQWAKEGK